MGSRSRAISLLAALAPLTCGHAHACDYSNTVLDGFAPGRRTIPADGHEDVRVRISEVLVSARDPLQWFGIRGEVVASDDPTVLNRQIEIDGHWDARCFARDRGYDIGMERFLTGWVVGKFSSAKAGKNAVLSFASETRPVPGRGRVLAWRRLRWAEPS